MKRTLKQVRSEELKRKKLEQRDLLESFYSCKSDTIPMIDTISGLKMNGACRLSANELNLETSDGVSIPIQEAFNLYINLRMSQELSMQAISTCANPVYSIGLDSGLITIHKVKGDAEWTTLEEDITFALNKAGYKF